MRKGRNGRNGRNEARAQRGSGATRLGRNEARAGATPADVVNIRRSGARSYEAAHPEVWEMLETLVDPLTRGDPESPLPWTSKSTSTLSSEL